MSDRLANAEGLAKALAPIVPAAKVVERLTKLGIPPAADGNPEASILSLVRASGIKSQGEATVLLVNLTGGSCTAEQVTIALKAGFPGAKIGARHGPHYLSLARTGKLDGVETSTIPHSARKAKKAATVTAPAVAAPGTPAAPAPAAVVQPAAPTEPVAPAIDVAALRTELEALSQKDLAARAKGLGVKAIGKKDAIIDAIIAAS